MSLNEHISSETMLSQKSIEAISFFVSSSQTGTHKVNGVWNKNVQTLIDKKKISSIVQLVYHYDSKLTGAADIWSIMLTV